MEMKLSLAHMYLNSLKHSEMDVRTITMFEVWVNINCLMKSVNNCRSSWTCCQRLSNNPKIDERSIVQSLGNKMSDSSQLFGKEDDLHKVCPPQFYEWDRRGVTTCKDFTHIDQNHTFRTPSLLGFQYNHEIIYQIMDWRTKSLRPKQFYVQKLRTKMMLLLLTNRVWSTNH
jgi:hypothetical protein